MKQMRKLRHREQKSPAQGHASGKWQGWIPNEAIWWGRVTAAVGHRLVGPRKLKRRVTR